MRVLQLYNQYQSPYCGEESIVRKIAALIEEHGDESELMIRSSRDLDGSLRSKVEAFLSGIYNPFSARLVKQTVSRFRPEVVHVHNLYPLFSPSVLPAIRGAGVPTVMTVHNNIHTCPATLNFRGEEVCELCAGGREYYCAIHNCKGDVATSVGYSIRSAVARRLRLFLDNVSVVIALSGFARTRLVQAGFSEDRVTVLPNMSVIPEQQAVPERGRLALYCGRLSPEKGVPVLLDAARRLPHIPVALVGGPASRVQVASAPDNVSFLGSLTAPEISGMYEAARFLVVPSRCYEGCPVVIQEAMGLGLPIIASRIAGLPELVDDGVTGLLFEPGDPVDLARKMDLLWSDDNLCAEMGRAGRDRAVREFSPDAYYQRLRSIYRNARV